MIGLAASKLGVMEPARDTLSPALEQTLARFAAMAKRVGQRHGFTGGDLDEVIQEVRIRLWRALREEEKIAAVSASYVYRVAASASVDIIRRRRARRETRVRLSRLSGEAVLGESPAADLGQEGTEVERQVARAIDGLVDSRRQVVRMYLAGYGREEIADLLGWTEAKTRNLLYRGLADLREQLTKMGIGPEAIG